MGPLSQVTVVECGEGITAAFAGRLLADLGAGVIKVESPQGDITRLRGAFPSGAGDAENSGLFLYLNAGKRGITLNLHNAGERAKLQTLLGRADVLLHNMPPCERGRLALDSARLCQNFPELVVATVSVYGGSGPRADYRAYDLNAFHASGAAAVNPFDSPYPELPPLKLFGSLAEFEGGLNLALVTLAAIWHRIGTGRGQAVDVSEQEALAATLEFNFINYSYAGIESSRFISRRSGPWFIARGEDGYVLFSFVYENHWTRFVEWIGHPQWAKDPDFADLTSRGLNSHKLRPLIEKWVRTWKVHDLFSQARAHGVPIVPLSTMAGVYNDEQLGARKFFMPLPARHSHSESLLVPGYPFKSTADLWTPRTAAPRLGEHNELIALSPERQEPAGRLRSKMLTAQAPKVPQPAPPLAGVRVLDFMQLWVGTFCSLQLAHLGAEVIRVESSLTTVSATRFAPICRRHTGSKSRRRFQPMESGQTQSSA